jgi:RNA polymerase sigma factor FliA
MGKQRSGASARSGRNSRLSVVEADAQQRSNQALWERYFQDGDPAVREQLILQYSPLVKYVMGRLAISLPAILDYEDILSFGTIGLIEAVERFDHTKGVKFETYAIARIRGAIIDALRSLDRLPRSVRQKAREANEAILRLTNELGRDPTDEEVAAALNVGADAYRKTQVDSSWITVSLDTLGMTDGEDDTGGAMAVADPDGEDFSADLERQELIGDLADAIRDLPDREQLILSLYYKEELTMREVSEVLGISESRVCQLHARALTRLRTGVVSRQQGQAA